MYLNKEQFCLLKRICSCGEMSYSSLSNQKKSFLSFCAMNILSVFPANLSRISTVKKFRISMVNRFLQKSQNRGNLT